MGGGPAEFALMVQSTPRASAQTAMDYPAPQQPMGACVDRVTCRQRNTQGDELATGDTKGWCVGGRRLSHLTAETPVACDYAQTRFDDDDAQLLHRGFHPTSSRDVAPWQCCVTRAGQGGRTGASKSLRTLA